MAIFTLHFGAGVKSGLKVLDTNCAIQMPLSWMGRRRTENKSEDLPNCSINQ